MATRPVYVDYVADIRHADGCSQIAHVREAIGARAVFAKIAHHFAGAKIVGFRHHEALTADDYAVIAQGNPGLVTNHWAGFGGP